MHVAGASLELIARSKRGAGISYTCRHSRSSQSANDITGLISIRSCAMLKCIYRVNVFVFMLLSYRVHVNLSIHVYGKSVFMCRPFREIVCAYLTVCLC